MALFKGAVVLVLLFVALAAMSGVFATTQSQRILSWGVFLILVVGVYSPLFWRWFCKKG